jgi:hypothetical protein
MKKLFLLIILSLVATSNLFALIGSSAPDSKRLGNQVTRFK